MDLGSGVGNVVLQVALEAGCKSFGIEVQDGPAKLAETFKDDFHKRCSMWSVHMAEVELVHGDMLASPRVQQLLQVADVVLVNNKVFGAELNGQIRPMFLELKEGAQVVSLEPFVSHRDSRVTDRNIDDLGSILTVVKKVTEDDEAFSWSGKQGEYWLHTIDREGYKRVLDRFESGRRKNQNDRSRKRGGEKWYPSRSDD
jgi:H3 lysine-79-specific histone-lysine N-methyltransferase